MQPRGVRALLRLQALALALEPVAHGGGLVIHARELHGEHGIRPKCRRAFIRCRRSRDLLVGRIAPRLEPGLVLFLELLETLQHLLHVHGRCVVELGKGGHRKRRNEQVEDGGFHGMGVN